MKSVLALVFLYSLSAFSAPKADGKTYVEQVESKLNSLFKDTVNEGGTRAEVERIKNKPNLKCGNIVRSGEKAIIFCTAHIKTTYYSGGKKRNGSTICTSLSFVVKNNKVGDRYRPEAFNMCMENIHDASYE